jgi:hypothetical protein
VNGVEDTGTRARRAEYEHDPAAAPPESRTVGILFPFEMRAVGRPQGAIKVGQALAIAPNLSSTVSFGLHVASPTGLALLACQSGDVVSDYRTRYASSASQVRSAGPRLIVLLATILANACSAPNT